MRGAQPSPRNRSALMSFCGVPSGLERSWTIRPPKMTTPQAPHREQSIVGEVTVGTLGDPRRCRSLAAKEHRASSAARARDRRLPSRRAPHNGLTSKIHAVVDADGLPVRLGLTPGEAHDNRLCSVLLSELRPRTILFADRGYDADWIRAIARDQGAWVNIPPKRICKSRSTQPIPLPSA